MSKQPETAFDQQLADFRAHILDKQPEKNEFFECLLCVFNNVASAKNAMLNGDTVRLKHHLDGALSWATPLIGKEHPMLTASGAFPAGQVPVLWHQDIQPQRSETETPSASPTK